MNERKATLTPVGLRKHCRGSAERSTMTSQSDAPAFPWPSRAGIAAQDRRHAHRVRPTKNSHIWLESDGSLEPLSRDFA